MKRCRALEVPWANQARSAVCLVVHQLKFSSVAGRGGVCDSTASTGQNVPCQVFSLQLHIGYIHSVAVYKMYSKAKAVLLPRRRLGGEEVQLILILDLGNRWGWVVSVTPRPCFSPGKTTPGTHCTGGWVGPRAGLDIKARGKILSLLPGIEPSPGHPVRSQTLYWLSYPAHLQES
jgi:hypothetical protein